MAFIECADSLLILLIDSFLEIPQTFKFFICQCSNYCHGFSVPGNIRVKQEMGMLAIGTVATEEFAAIRAKECKWLVVVSAYAHVLVDCWVFLCHNIIIDNGNLVLSLLSLC